MEIKSLNINAATSLDQSKKTEAPKSVKTEDSSADRDADGRRQKEDSHEQSKLSSEELEQALEIIRNLEGVKSHNLVVKLIDEGELKWVSVEDSYGKVIRRISEYDLPYVLKEKEKSTGHLYSKAM